VRRAAGGEVAADSRSPHERHVTIDWRFSGLATVRNHVAARRAQQRTA